jgi:hypothetical protein
MALSNATFSDIGGAVSDLFSAQANSGSYEAKALGADAEAKNYNLAAGFARQNVDYQTESTAIQVMQQNRTNYQQYGGAQSDIAGAGFRQSGSGLYILADNARQGSLATSVLQKQGAIQEAGYQEQAQSYDILSSAATQQAKADREAADESEDAGFFGAVIKGAAGLATLFMK